jgi:hypothetical protein
MRFETDRGNYGAPSYQLEGQRRWHRYYWCHGQLLGLVGHRKRGEEGRKQIHKVEDIQKFCRWARGVPFCVSRPKNNSTINRMCNNVAGPLLQVVNQ